MSRVVLTGSTLTLDDVLAVARGGAQVEIDAGRARRDGRGARRRRPLDRGRDAGLRRHDRRRQPQGVRRRRRRPRPAPRPPAPDLAGRSRRRTRSCGRRRSGSRTRSRGRRPVARPELASHLVAALNDDRLPEIRTLGSIGQSDLAQMADLADGVLGDFELARGEAIALLNQSAFATAYGALAFADALVLLDVFDHAGALDLEALGANRTPSTRRSATRGPTRGCRPRSPASARCSRAARWRRATCRTRSRSGRSPSRTAPRATRSRSSARSSRSSSTRRSRTRSSSSTRTG